MCCCGVRRIQRRSVVVLRRASYVFAVENTVFVCYSPILVYSRYAEDAACYRLLFCSCVDFTQLFSIFSYFACHYINSCFAPDKSPLGRSPLSCKSSSLILRVLCMALFNTIGLCHRFICELSFVAYLRQETGFSVLEYALNTADMATEVGNAHTLVRSRKCFVFFSSLFYIELWNTL